jgi:hypothetical protein
MERTERHRDVEYSIKLGHKEVVFETLDDAAPYVLSAALAEGRAHLDVLVHSADGAAWYGGDEAVALYQDDPEASVFERIEVRASSQGRIP